MTVIQFLEQSINVLSKKQMLLIQEMDSMLNELNVENIADIKPWDLEKLVSLEYDLIDTIKRKRDIGTFICESRISNIRRKEAENKES